jgi:diguanylate cyclase (GGDEF)-like protein/PAS domain S-box-containing protein
VTGPQLGPEDRLRLLDDLGQAVIATDPEGRVTYWNLAAEQLYGWTAAESLGRNISELTVPEFSQAIGSEIMARLTRGESWSGGFTVRRKDGSLFTALVTDSNVRDAAGDVVGVVGVSINLGEMLRPLLAWSREVVVVTSDTGIVHFASPAVERLTGLPAEGLPGQPLSSLVPVEDRELLEQVVLTAASQPQGSLTTDFRVLGADGGWTWVEAVVASVLDDPTVKGLVWTLHDISDRRVALDAMTEMALHDPLTGLPNRALLWDRLAQLTARRAPHGALLFIDLDDFKSVNDELGHAAGDTTLKIIAGRLSHLVRPEDSCGRWAGDEFMVLNESLRSQSAAVALARRVESAIAAPIEINGHTLTPRASIGVAMLEGQHDPEQVLYLADRNMYEVKERHHRAPDLGS